MRNVRIKICGITRVEDAEIAVALGADFVGLNFWQRSSRAVDLERGREIAERVRGRTSVVGVFVNPDRCEVEAVLAEVGLDLIQFHGDESPSELAPWGERALKAMRFSDELDPEALNGYKTVWGFLIEPHRDAHGGSGQSWDYSAARRLTRHKPFLLAGGLGPENVAAAINASSPWGVDVCSGVESSPGIKDGEALRRFFAEVERVAG